MLRSASENITIMSEDPSDDPDDYAMKMADNVPADLALLMDVELSGGRAIKANDEILIPIESHYVTTGTVKSADLEIADFAYGKLMSGGSVIGLFKRVDNGILLSFAREAAGLTSLKNLSLTAKGIARSESIGKNRVGYITVAGKNYYFGISQTNLTNLTDNTYPSATADNNVTWTTNVGSDLTNTLSRSSGTTGVATDVYVEQSFPGAIGFNGISVYEAHRIPVGLVLGEQSNASSMVADQIDRTNEFTEIKQNGDEGYAAFARRVMSNALQYGFYQDSDQLRLIINYGALGVDTPFAASEAWAEDAADNAVAQGYYVAADKNPLAAYFTDCYGAHSALQQSPSSFFNVNVTYPSDRVDDVTTTARIYDNDVAESHGSRASLAILTGELIIPARQAQLVVVDDLDASTVNGGLYKLQRKKSDGTFEDYAPTEEYENKKRVTKNGTIIFDDLEDGAYRFVGLEVPEGYDIAGSEGYSKTDKVTYSKEFNIDGYDGARIVVGIKKIATPEPEDDDDDDSPAAPKTGLGSADETSGSTDAGIYAMTAFGIAMIVIAIKRKVSLD